MRKIEYKDFSFKLHRNNLADHTPSACQFELTFGCGLHCRHCYSDCYNNPKAVKRELGTKQVKSILDKVREAGVLWLCFTGGDPLTRKDFPEVYTYALARGFIVTVFTNGYSMNRTIARLFRRERPFAVEMTLNAVDKELYENISRVKGSFEKTRAGIELMLENKFPLKIKTQITTDNLFHVPGIKKFLKGIKKDFFATYILNPRLNGDASVCGLRLPASEVLNLRRKNGEASGCKPKPVPGDDLYPCCAASGDTFFIDPYGHMFLCNLMRSPGVDLLKKETLPSLRMLAADMGNKRLPGNSPCLKCGVRSSCLICPGRAYLETGKDDQPVDYYCRLAHAKNN
jgi:radical SAM protein with 4Fe4S-binding SPASM domain